MPKPIKSLFKALGFLLALNFLADGQYRSPINLENGKVVKEKVYENSKQKLIYIKDHHLPHRSAKSYSNPDVRSYVYDVQKDILLILDELYRENDVKLVGFEGFHAEYFLPKKSGILEKSDSRADAVKYALKILADSSSAAYLRAVPLIEELYTDSVITIGVEDKGLFQATDILEDYYIKQKIPRKLHEEITVKRRSYICVENIIAQMKSRGIRSAALVFGSNHEETIISALDSINAAQLGAEMVSYYVVEPKSYKQE